MAHLEGADRRVGPETGARSSRRSQAAPGQGVSVAAKPRGTALPSTGCAPTCRPASSPGPEPRCGGSVGPAGGPHHELAHGRCGPVRPREPDDPAGPAASLPEEAIRSPSNGSEALVGIDVSASTVLNRAGATTAGVERGARVIPHQRKRNTGIIGLGGLLSGAALVAHVVAGVLLRPVLVLTAGLAASVAAFVVTLQQWQRVAAHGAAQVAMLEEVAARARRRGARQ